MPQSLEMTSPISMMIWKQFFMANLKISKHRKLIT
jgi:hypothetical protein